MATKTKTISSMDQLAEEYLDKLVPFSEGGAVEIKVLQKTKSHLMVDVAGVAIGIIPEQEFSYDAEEIEIGDTVLAYVLMAENEDGYVVLSLKRADRERVWKTLETKHKKGEALKVKPSSANRGGLIVEFGGIDGFIPVSQLAPAHYPKVEDGDANKILARLKNLVGEVLLVKVLSLDSKNNKLIFSEKSVTNERLIQASQELKTGQKLTAEITGVVDFGIFVKIDVATGKDKREKIDGLIHVSEISWNKEENWKTRYKVGQKIEVAVVSTQGGRVSLSLKQLQDNPWEKAAKKFQEGDKIEAEVTRLTPFGAFVKISDNLDGLVHISQIDKRKASSMKEGEKYPFYILKIDAENRRINLSMKKPKAEK